MLLKTKDSGFGSHNVEGGVPDPFEVRRLAAALPPRAAMRKRCQGTAHQSALRHKRKSSERSGDVVDNKGWSISGRMPGGWSWVLKCAQPPVSGRRHLTHTPRDANLESRVSQASPKRGKAGYNTRFVTSHWRHSYYAVTRLQKRGVKRFQGQS